MKAFLIAHAILSFDKMYMGRKARILMRSIQSNTRTLAISAIFSAAAAMFLVIGSVMPVGAPILLFLSTFVMCIIVNENGIKYGFCSFAVSGIISMILCADKSIALYYCIFFGWYPIVKLMIERMRKIRIEYIIKSSIGIIMGVVFVGIIRLMGMGEEQAAEFFSIGLFKTASSVGIPFWVFAAVMCIFTVLAFDFLLTNFITFYCVRVRKYIKKIK